MRGVCDFTLDVFDFLSQIELLLCEFGIVSRIRFSADFLDDFRALPCTNDRFKLQIEHFKS